MANPESLKDKARGKCLIYRRAGHWAKECPNHDKFPRNGLLQMPSVGKLSGTLSLAPKSLKVKHYDGSTGLKQPAPASPPVTDKHHRLEPQVQRDVAGGSENFLVDTGVTYSVLTSYSRAFSSQTCTIWGAIGKTVTKIFTQALLCCWDGQIFSHQFLVVPECPTPLLGRDIPS